MRACACAGLGGAHARVRVGCAAVREHGCVCAVQLEDCDLSVKLNPSYTKGLARRGECLIQVPAFHSFSLNPTPPHPSLTLSFISHSLDPPVHLTLPYPEILRFSFHTFFRLTVCLSRHPCLPDSPTAYTSACHSPPSRAHWVHTGRARCCSAIPAPRAASLQSFCPRAAVRCSTAPALGCCV